VDSEASRNLEQQINELRSQIQRLEGALRRHGIELGDQSPAQNPKSTQPARATDFPALHTPDALSPSSNAPECEMPAERSLENKIGSQWFNRIGILAVFIAMAWFLRLAIDNHWIGPLGRVLVGLIAGTGVIAWSERFRRKGYPWFAYSLKGVGSGILYLSLWAAFSTYHLIPVTVAFAAMILVTAFNGFLSWIQSAELLALYAIVGGFCTPLLLSTNDNREISLFSYLLLLNLAVFILITLCGWWRLLLAAFLGTVFFYASWCFEYYSPSQMGWTSFFLICFFLMFALAPSIARFGRDQPGEQSRWSSVAWIVLPIANAALAFVAFYEMLSALQTEWAKPTMAVAFAAFYLGLLRLPERKAAAVEYPSLAGVHVTTAIVFLTIAIPLATHGRWMTIGWLAEGATLVWAAARLRKRTLGALGLLSLTMGLTVLIAVNPAASATPFLNQRFATFCAGIAAFAFTGWIASRERRLPVEQFVISWPQIEAASVLIVNLLVLVAIGWEIHCYWHGRESALERYVIFAQFTYSALFMIFGAVLLAAGFWRKSAFLRWQALVLLAIAIAKVFLADVRQLSEGYRIVSFLALGVLLLTVSFVYERDWLNLRNREVEK
jgi:uncharacterized membrane protein